MSLSPRKSGYQLPAYMVIPFCLVSLPIDIAVDTICLPYDIPSFIYYYYKFQQNEEEKRLAKLVKENPNIIVEEQWSKKSKSHKNAIGKTLHVYHLEESERNSGRKSSSKSSTADIAIPYTNEQLEEIFKISEIREVLLGARECGEDFILRHFDEIASLKSEVLFRSISENQNATNKLFKKIISLKQNTGVTSELIPRVTVHINEPILLMTSTEKSAEYVAFGIRLKKILQGKPTGQFISAKNKETLNVLLRDEQVLMGNWHYEKKWLRDADRGVLFVGKLETLNHTEQAALLRLVKEKTFRVIGTGEEIRVDCQLIGEATEELPRLVREGKFSAELLACFEGRVFYLDSWWDSHPNSANGDEKSAKAE
jgi:hypothetical protein